MSRPDIPHDFYPLVDALLHDTIAADEHARLSEMLAQNAELRDEYAHYVDLHLELRRLHRYPEGEPATVAAPTVPRLPRRWKAPAVAALALGLMCVAALPFVRPAAAPVNSTASTTLPKSAPSVVTPSLADPVVADPPAADSPAADPVATSRESVAGAVTLTQASDAVFFGELTPPLRSELPYGHTFALREGTVELTFPSSAAALIKAPAMFVIDGPARLRLHVGGCSVHAPDGAEGFQVITPKSEITDLGTRFFVKVGETGESEVQVVEGAAAVRTTAGAGETRTLSEREAVRTRIDRPRPEAIPFDGEEYLTGLPDRVLSYDALPGRDAKSGGIATVRDLASVTVQRGGFARTYRTEELIGIEIVHFRATKNTSNLTWDESSSGRPADMLERDAALNTGVINPGGRPAEQVNGPVTEANWRERPGLAVRFRTPVRNDAGPDVVLFEIQSPIYPPEGDAFRVGPRVTTPGLRDHLVGRYDITLYSRNALVVDPFQLATFPKAPASLADVVRPASREFTRTQSHFSALAVGIDLSDIGYPAGAEVTELFFEDDAADSHFFDPVLIGGLPPLPADAATPR